MTSEDLKPGTILVRATIKAIAEGPQVVFERVKVHSIDADPTVRDALYNLVDPLADCTSDAIKVKGTEFLSDLAKGGWRLTEETAVDFLREQAITVRARYFDQVVGISQELAAILSHGKSTPIQSPIQPIYANLPLAETGDQKIWGVSALFGDSRVQILIGSMNGVEPAVTITLAGLSHAITEDDLDEPTPFALAEYPAICIRFKSFGGLRALRASLEVAERRLADMNIQNDRARLVVEKDATPLVVLTDPDECEGSDGSQIPVDDVSHAGIDKANEVTN